jgi:hypothetical protein
MDAQNSPKIAKKKKSIKSIYILLMQKKKNRVIFGSRLFHVLRGLLRFGHRNRSGKT